MMAPWFDLARCEDHECPSAKSCMRSMVHGQIKTSVIDFKREPEEQRCVVGWWPFDKEGQQQQLQAQRVRRQSYLRR